MDLATEDLKQKRPVGRPPKPKSILDGAVQEVEIHASGEGYVPADIVRFNLAPSDPLSNWLLSRLEKDKPYYGRAAWLSQILQATNSNEWHIMRLNQSVFMGTIHKDPMDPRPRVQEFICWSMDQSRSDCIKLYREARKWAHSMNAVCVNLGRSSDITVGQIKSDLDAQYPAEVFLDLTK